MKIEFKDFGFYLIDEAYLKYLHSLDPEVRYDEYKNYEKKPFVGILVIIDKYTFFLPLTSAKRKHKNWNNVDKTHYLIYEIIDKTDAKTFDVVKPFSDSQVIRIMAALDIKKMVPVPEGLYTRKDFTNEPDQKYRDLLRKEYRFCLGIQQGILDRAKAIYKEQKETGKIYKFYCNYGLLENACDKYLNNYL